METVGLLLLMVVILGGGYLLTGSLDNLLERLTFKERFFDQPDSK